MVDALRSPSAVGLRTAFLAGSSYRNVTDDLEQWFWVIFRRDFYPKLPRVLDLGCQRSDRQ